MDSKATWTSQIVIRNGNSALSMRNPAITPKVNTFNVHVATSSVTETNYFTTNHADIPPPATVREAQPLALSITTDGAYVKTLPIDIPEELPRNKKGQALLFDPLKHTTVFQDFSEAGFRLATTSINGFFWIEVDDRGKTMPSKYKLGHATLDREARHFLRNQPGAGALLVIVLQPEIASPPEPATYHYTTIDESEPLNSASYQFDFEQPIVLEQYDSEPHKTYEELLADVEYFKVKSSGRERQLALENNALNKELENANQRADDLDQEKQYAESQARIANARVNKFRPVFEQAQFTAETNPHGQAARNAALELENADLGAENVDLADQLDRAQRKTERVDNQRFLEWNDRVYYQSMYGETLQKCSELEEALYGARRERDEKATTQFLKCAIHGSISKKMPKPASARPQPVKTDEMVGVQYN